MATFWDITAHSVDHMFSLFFTFISRFGFEGLIWDLIASVHYLCILFTFMFLKKGIDTRGLSVPVSGLYTCMNIIFKVGMIAVDMIAYHTRF